MKKYVATALILIMAFSLTACRLNASMDTETTTNTRPTNTTPATNPTILPNPTIETNIPDPSVDTSMPIGDETTNGVRSRLVG